MAKNNEIPENANNLLFAQDLMNHVMKNTIGATYTEMTAARYRDVIYTAFNETITKAVSFLFNKMDIEIKNTISAMLNEQSVNLVRYTKYAENVSQNYITNSRNAIGFLHYCVRLAGVAAYFYGYGVVDAPSLAVTYIVKALDNGNVTTTGWYILNVVGGRFASLENDIINLPSPQSSFSEEDYFPNSEQSMDESSSSRAISSPAGSSSLSTDDFKEHKVRIQNVLVEDFHQHSNSSSSSESMEDSKKFKKFRPASSGNSSNFVEHKLVSGSSSPESLATGTSNTIGLAPRVRSMKSDYLDTTLKEINHDIAENVQTRTSENELGMSGVTTKYEIKNSESEDISDSDDVSDTDDNSDTNEISDSDGISD